MLACLSSGVNSQFIREHPLMTLRNCSQQEFLATETPAALPTTRFYNMGKAQEHLCCCFPISEVWARHWAWGCAPRNLEDSTDIQTVLPVYSLETSCNKKSLIEERLKEWVMKGRKRWVCVTFQKFQLTSEN